MPLEIRAPQSPRLRLVPPVPTDLSLTAQRGEPGKSAYQSAVDSGFLGTEQEWVDSIVTTDDLNAHINDETPHPVYDDIPSLNLLFENGLI